MFSQKLKERCQCCLSFLLFENLESNSLSIFFWMIIFLCFFFQLAEMETTPIMSECYLDKIMGFHLNTLTSKFSICSMKYISYLQFSFLSTRLYHIFWVCTNESLVPTDHSSFLEFCHQFRIWNMNIIFPIVQETVEKVSLWSSMSSFHRRHGDHHLGETESPTQFIQVYLFLLAFFLFPNIT